MIIRGKVIKGDGYGRKLGFPTANLETTSPLPKNGVYAGTATVDNKEYKAGIVVGPLSKIEGHIIGFEGDLYGQEISLEIKRFLRDYKVFYEERELINQIKEDIKSC